MAALTVAVTGSSGLIGTALRGRLSANGHRVIQFVRRSPAGGWERRWEPEHPDKEILDGVDVVVHLAGEPLGGRFTRSHMAEIRDSRVIPTRRLSERIAEMAGAVTLVSGSAVGYYGPDRGDELLTENSTRGEGFLADLVADWEDATTPARDAGARVINVRTGIVQSRHGGTLKLLYPLFSAGLGGRLGDGRQWLSWIAIDDMSDVLVRAVCDPTLNGPINAVAPTPVRNSDYAATLAKVLHRPAVLPVPSFGPRLLLGKEGAKEMAMAGQRVVPQRLLDAGHVFAYPELESALRRVLNRAA